MRIGGGTSKARGTARVLSVVVIAALSGDAQAPSHCESRCLAGKAGTDRLAAPGAGPSELRLSALHVAVCDSDGRYVATTRLVPVVSAHWQGPSIAHGNERPQPAAPAGTARGSNLWRMRRREVAVVRAGEVPG